MKGKNLSSLFKKGAAEYIFGGICTLLAIYFVADRSYILGMDSGIDKGCEGEANMAAACILRKYGDEEGRDIIHKINDALNEEMPKLRKEVCK